MSVVTLARSEIWTDEGTYSTIRNDDLLMLDCYLKTVLTNICQLERRRGQGSAATIPAWVVKNTLVYLKTKFPHQDFPPNYTIYIFESKKFPCTTTCSICSRKTRRRPRVKTKFSFMPEGQQREVGKKSKRGKTWNCSSGAQGLNNLKFFLFWKAK